MKAKLMKWQLSRGMSFQQSSFAQVILHYLTVFLRIQSRHSATSGIVYHVEIPRVYFRNSLFMRSLPIDFSLALELNSWKSPKIGLLERLISGGVGFRSLEGISGCFFAPAPPPPALHRSLVM